MPVLEIVQLELKRLCPRAEVVARRVQVGCALRLARGGIATEDQRWGDVDQLLQARAGRNELERLLECIKCGGRRGRHVLDSLGERLVGSNLKHRGLLGLALQ